jgi:uncharacterized surface protein with fasciclin (FAS1) repeats
MGVFSACYKTTPQGTGSGGGLTLVQPLQSILSNNADFSDFDTLLKRSGLYQRVTGDSSFTVLIPDNAAFAASAISFDSLLRLPPDSLQSFIGYHLLAGSFPTNTIPQTIDNPYTTLSGQTIYFSKPLNNNINYSAQTLATGSATLNVNGVTTTKTDLLTTNGVVHVLSAPLSTPYGSIQAFLASRPEYSYLVTALKQFNLWNELDSAGPYTLFAPNNDAFINNGVTLSMITSDTFNIAHYEPFLFSAGILPTRVFLTDFTDAATSLFGNGLSPAIYTSYGWVAFSNISSSYSTPNINAYDWIPQMYGGYNQIGGYPQYTVTNQPAANGVINGITDLLVYPDSVYNNRP